MEHDKSHNKEEPKDSVIQEETLFIDTTQNEVQSKPSFTNAKKAFSQSGHLTRHKRFHTGEKRHNCDQCDKSGYSV